MNENNVLNTFKVLRALPILKRRLQWAQNFPSWANKSHSLFSNVNAVEKVIKTGPSYRKHNSY